MYVSLQTLCVPMISPRRSLVAKQWTVRPAGTSATGQRYVILTLLHAITDNVKPLSSDCAKFLFVFNIAHFAFELYLHFLAYVLFI